jgi:hypothetical protein
VQSRSQSRSNALLCWCSGTDSGASYSHLQQQNRVQN